MRLYFLATLSIILLSMGPSAATGNPPPQGGYEVEPDQRVGFDDAWQSYRAHGPLRQPNYVRPVLQNIGALSIGSMTLWALMGNEGYDPDLPLDRRVIGSQFVDPGFIRFDDNPFFVNQGHVLAGSVYYGLSRANNLGPGTSFAYALGSAAAWEWVFEILEYPSINDLITTPLGGVGVGEVFYHLGEVYHAGDLNLAAKILTAPFGAPRGLNDWFDHAEDDPAFNPRFGNPVHHHFDFGLGATARSIGDVDTQTQAASTVDLSTRVVSLPGYGSVGRFSTGFANGNFTALDVGTEFGRGGFEAAHVRAQALIYGFYTQSINAAGRGYTLAVGGAHGARLDYRDHPHFDDRLGVVDLIGPGVVFEAHEGNLRVGLELDAGFEFGSVHSMAYTEFARRYGAEGVRTELAEDYYFAFGGSGASLLRIDYGPLGLGTAARYGHYLSADGRDRVYESDIPTPLRLEDRRLTFGTWAQWRFVDDLALRLDYEALRRDGKIDDLISRSATLRTYQASLHYLF